MTRCVFISPYLADKTSGGGLVSRSNLYCLSKLIPETEAYVLSNESPGFGVVNLGKPSGKLSTALYNLIGLAGRLSFSSIAKISLIIYNKKPDILFLDSSSIGIISLISRFISPSTRIFIFFHNIEYDFQRSRSVQESNFYRITAIAEYINEKLSINYAKSLLMLTREDSDRSKNLYGRPADHITPVVFYSEKTPKPFLLKNKKIFLFVGSNFYANRQAVEFIINKISPLLLNEDNIEIWIAGKGFSANDWKGSINNNVKMLGSFDDLDGLYEAAYATIAPIFSGAGMKVKIAESLMHGRPVIGTNLALRGYLDNENYPHLISAETAEDFGNAIKAMSLSQKDLTNSCYKDFEERFSMESGLIRMKKILKI